jgi:hypothetical protein
MGATNRTGSKLAPVIERHSSFKYTQRDKDRYLPVPANLKRQVATRGAHGRCKSHQARDRLLFDGLGEMILSETTLIGLWANPS